MAQGTIGGKIVLEGEKEYRQALKQIKTAQTELKSELKLCAAEFKNNDKSVEALQKKHQIMAKQVEESAKKVQVYEKMLVSSGETQTKTAEKVKNLQEALESEKKKLTELATTEGTTNEALEEQKKKIQDIGVELAKANEGYQAAVDKTARYQTALNNANTELIQMTDELEANDRALEEANNQIDPLNDSLKEYEETIGDASENTDIFGDVLKANLTSDVIIQSVRALTSAVKESAEACIETGMQFEASMSNVKALSNATEEEMQLLSEKAKQMGASTMFSASQAGDAMGYMALAGWNVKDMLDGIEPILNLAAAANMDLAQTSDIVTDYLTAFGLTAKDASRFTDQLAYAMSNSNTDVVQLGEAYKNCAATAHSLGYSVEDVTAALMTMANAGVKGGEAGTGLSTIMTRLATNTKDCGDALAEYGIHIYDSEGKMNSLSSILEGMSGIWSTLTDQQQAGLAKTVAGVNQYSKLQTIMAGLSEQAKESGMSFGDYAEALEHADGSAKAMADTMQDNLKGKLTILESSLDALKQSTYETFDESLKISVDGATTAVTRLNNAVRNGSLHVSLTRLGNEFSDLALRGIEVGERVLPEIIDGATWLLDNAGVIASGVGGIVAAQVTMNKVVPILKSATAGWQAYKMANEGATIAQYAMNTAMIANPAGLIITAVAGLTAATIAYSVSLSNQKTEAEKAFEVMIDGYENVVNSSKQLAESSQSFSTSQQNEYQYVSGLVNELEQLNSKESLNAQEKKRISDITKELNTRYADLNLQIDKQTGKLVSNEKNWQDLINTQLKQAQLSKVQDELLTIYEQQAENEYNLWEIGKNLADNDERRAQISERLIELQNKGIDANMAEMDEMQKLYDEAEALTEQDNKLIEQQDKLKASNEDLLGTTQELDEYMRENLGVTVDAAGNIQELGEAADGTAESISGLSQAVSEEMAEMYDNVIKSVEGQMNIFEAFSAKTDVTKEQLLKNIESQIEGIENWADNLQALADRGVNQGLLKTLSEMGPEGAGYVKAFVEMTDEELAGYGEKFQQAAVLPSEVTSKIMQSYQKLGQDNVDAMAAGIDESTAIEEAIRKTVDNGIEEAKKAKQDKSTKVGTELVEDIADGIKGSSRAVDAATKAAGDILSAFQKNLSKEKGAQIGANVTEGIASGIERGASALTTAASKIADTVVNTMSKATDSVNDLQSSTYQAESKIVSSKQSQMSNSSPVMGAMSYNAATVNSYSSAPATASSDQTAQKILNLLDKSLPEMSKPTKVEMSVGMEPNSQQFFEEMRVQSRIYKEATGEAL